MAKQIFFDDFIDKRLDTSKWSPVWGKFDPNKGTQMGFTDKIYLFNTQMIFGCWAVPLLHKKI